MSRNRPCWEEPATSYWDPAPARSRGGRYGWRSHHSPPTEVLPTVIFNYWRDEPVAPTTYYPQRSHQWEDHDEQRRGSDRSWRGESSYSRRRHDFGPGGLDRGDRGRSSHPYGSPPRRRYSRYTPQPYIPLSTFRAGSPVEPISPSLKPASPRPPRKMSPPQSSSSQPLEPSPGYLSLSQELSEVLQDPGSSRKLLVLDLNGTLLIRSPRSRASSGPQLRPVQPRPYMPSFRQYLFCPETKAWLDTMVWSSAQPHSVDDMVNKVFGTAKDELKGVWNRKSLGLSEAEYHRKAVTTKDLTKPWDFLASSLTPEKHEGHPVVPSRSRVIHSAFTTLLLDDSPHKAALQPYNHVCIPEYDSTRRQHDLRFYLALKEPKDGKKNKKAKRKKQVDTVPCSTDRMVPEQPAKGAPSELTDTEPYDAILLAVIGILEAVRLQSNVAGWIRKGGLWAMQERRDAGGAGCQVLHLRQVDKGKTALNTNLGAGNDESSTSDPAVIPKQAHSQARMWFDDPLVVAYWVTRGRRALIELDIRVVHGVMG